MAEQEQDVIEVLEHDHREVEDMFAELESRRDVSSSVDAVQRQAIFSVPAAGGAARRLTGWGLAAEHPTRGRGAVGRCTRSSVPRVG